VAEVQTFSTKGGNRLPVGRHREGRNDGFVFPKLEWVGAKVSGFRCREDGGSLMVVMRSDVGDPPGPLPPT